MAIPAYYSLIQKGSYGPDEALVQTWLNGVRDQCSYYPALTIDGRFGTRLSLIHISEPTRPY